MPIRRVRSLVLLGKMRKEFGYRKGLWVVAFLLVLLTSSCITRKDVAYLQDLKYGEPIPYEQVEPKIQPGDLLSITVNSKNPELATPFNLPMVGLYRPGGVTDAGITRFQGYTVESDGTISFPILGRIKAAGYSRIELSRQIETLLSKDRLINDATVTTNYLNFRVSVLGEVNRPGSFTVDNDRFSLFDAIAFAGDLTLSARRDNVVVLREKEGKREAFVLDLRSADIFSSPCFYLQQNDVVMVESNAVKIQNTGINTYTNIGTWMSVLSTGTSLAAFIITLQNNSRK